MSRSDEGPEAEEGFHVQVSIGHVTDGAIGFNIDRAEHVHIQSPPDHTYGDYDGPPAPLRSLLGLPRKRRIDGDQPSACLAAANEVVDFAGRRELLADLDAWADTDDDVRLRLIYGPGGMGKTRLLHEWLKRRHARGEAVGFFLGPFSPAAAKALRTAPRACVVIDYAEARGLHALQPFLRHLQPWTPEAPPPPTRWQRMTGWFRARPNPTLRGLRIILLARHTGGWWHALRTGETSDLVAEAGRGLLLEPLVAKGDRRAEFLRAMNAFDPGLTVARPKIELGDARYARVLYLHAAALAVCRKLSFEPETLLDVVVNHEASFWLRRAGAPAEPEGFLEDARLAVAAITLRGGSEAPSEVLRRMAPRHAERLAEVLPRIYPTASGGAIAPLTPDLLGETLLLQVLAPRSPTDEGQRVEDLDFLDVALVDADEEALKNALVVLARLDAHFPSEIEDTLAARAQERVMTTDIDRRAVLACRVLQERERADEVKGTRLGQRLAQALEKRGSPELALKLEPEVPGETVQLCEVGLWIIRSKLQALPAETKPEERARLLVTFGYRLSQVGRREEALVATAEAVERYRTLAAARPDAFLPDLASSLTNLGKDLSALGRREEALAATVEAVDLRRTLAAARPDVFLLNLATSLNNLGGMLSDLGQREEALAATVEAVELYRTLAAARPDAFLPYLATSLNNLGKGRSALGRPEEALAATAEAVELYRNLAAARPDAFLPYLATSLANLGRDLSALGRREEALVATVEALELDRTLAAALPDAFLPNLATSLNSLGIRLSALGQREEALAATVEAVDLRRTLAAARPDAFLPYLASSLTNLGRDLSALGRREEALAATTETVALYRTLAAARPDSFLPYLASSLTNLGRDLSALGRREEALAATTEAVALYRTLAAARPDALLPDLASSLNNQGRDLSALGRREETLAATTEAVALYRTLAAARPDAFLPDLASSLNNQGAMLFALDRRREEDLAVTVEAVELYRTLAAARPDAFLPDLASSLNNQGAMLSALGRREEALAVTVEAVELHRTLAAARPDAFLPSLASSLNNQGAMLSALGQREEALAVTVEAVELYRTLAVARPDAFLPYLASSLNNQGSQLSNLGRREEALTAWFEGLDRIWPYFLKYPPGLSNWTGTLLRNCLRHFDDPPPQLRERQRIFEQLTRPR